MNKSTPFRIALLAGAAVLASNALAQSERDATIQREQRIVIKQHAEAAAAAATVARAQTEAAAAAARAHAHAEFAARDMQVAAAQMADNAFEFARVELGSEKLVKGAPYCAEAVHETVQPLLDGNRIVRAQSSRLCRDGEGRTRQEVERGGRHLVYLRDPVAREAWVLDREHRTARRLGGFHAGHEVDHKAWQEYGEQMREWAKKFREQVKIKGDRDGIPVIPPPALPVPPAPPSAAAPPAPPAPVIVTHNETRDEQGRVRREVEVKVVRLDGQGAPLPPLPAMPAVPAVPALSALPAVPAAVSMRALHFAPRGPGVVTAIGGKEIDGLKVNGERTTWTIEAGKVGNEKPIVITREVWTSPDLSLTVATRDFDPRSGEVNYRLQNVRRGEPDAALMKVPADYTRPEPRVAPAARPARPASSVRG